MDDYITGVEQVGADPTVAVETVAPVETKEKVDPAPDVYEFKEYNLKEYDAKELEKPYDYGDYGDFGHTDGKPTPAAYEEEFGLGVPAETDFRESNVRGAEDREYRDALVGMFDGLSFVFFFFFPPPRPKVSGSGLEPDTLRSKTHTRTLHLSYSEADKHMSTQLSAPAPPPPTPQ